MKFFSENEIPPKYTSAFSCVLVCSFGQHRAQKWHRFIWSLLITWLSRAGKRNEAYEPQFCIAKRAIQRQRQQQNRPRQKKKSSTSRSCVLQSWHNVLLFVRMARKKNTVFWYVCILCVFPPLISCILIDFVSLVVGCFFISLACDTVYIIWSYHTVLHALHIRAPQLMRRCQESHWRKREKKTVEKTSQPFGKIVNGGNGSLFNIKTHSRRDGNLLLLHKFRIFQAHPIHKPNRYIHK